MSYYQNLQENRGACEQFVCSLWITYFFNVGLISLIHTGRDYFYSPHQTFDTMFHEGCTSVSVYPLSARRHPPSIHCMPHIGRYKRSRFRASIFLHLKVVTHQVQRNQLARFHRNAVPSLHVGPGCQPPIASIPVTAAERGVEVDEHLIGKPANSHWRTQNRRIVTLNFGS